MKLPLHFAAIALLAALCGCVTVDEEARNAIAALSIGDDATAIAWSDELADGSHYSQNLGFVESGRSHMLAGDYQAASVRFRAAVDSAVERSETAPKMKLSDWGNTALSSTVTDDRTRQYYLPPYEINLALEYGIITQLFAGKRDDALIDARLSIYVQDTLAETCGADLAKEPEGSNETTRSLAATQSANLEEMIASTRNSWENPALWWLSGVLLESNGELDMAWQSYRKAAAIKPGNPFFAADAARADVGASTPRAGKSKLVVVYDQGFVPMRESLEIPVPLYTGFAIQIPKYPSVAFVENRVSVAGASGAKEASPAVDVRSLAARDLKEQLPGIITRNVTRAAVQAGAQAAVNAAGNEYAQLAVFVGNAVVSAMRSADTRSWRTLPASQQVWCDAEMEPGVYDVAVSVNVRIVTARIPLAPGETRLLWLADTGTIVRGASAAVGAFGAPVMDLSGKEKYP